MIFPKNFRQQGTVALRFIFIGLMLTFFGYEDCLSQQILRAKITGTVVDDSTGAPLHLANVFLSNTMLGAATDEDGYFTIVNIPPGMYELVISMVGYELLVIPIDMTVTTSASYEIRLKSKPIPAPKVEVTAPYPRKWKKNLKRFMKCFFGKNPDIGECTLLNPEVLDFTFDEEYDILFASATEPIRIENRMLGYQVHCFLYDFAAKQDVFLKCLHRSRFIGMSPENDKEAKKWKKNRLRAYLGSFRHFLSSLYEGRQREEGFYIKLDFDLTVYDDTYYLSNVLADDLFAPGRTTLGKQFIFYEYLRVIYMPDMREDARQTSWIRLDPRATIIVYPQGYVSDPYAITRFGFWAGVGFSEELPFDYSPDEEIKYKR